MLFFKRRQKIGKQGTWLKACSLFFLPLFFLFSFRWLFFEPFVIPSESMFPNLMIHDHILVRKWSYGIKAPLGDGWIYNFSSPQRGDIIVFRYPENRDIFFIKRLVGLPGDQVTIQGMSLKLNGVLLDLEPTPHLGEFVEVISNDKKYIVRYESELEQSEESDLKLQTFTVPPNQYFVLGDNRNNSRDSRFWGFVPHELLVGQAEYIWLSCEETLVSLPFVCDPKTFRYERLFKKIQ